jgi:hypothetical protein
MAIIVNNRSDQSELQQRITAELREKQSRKSLDDDLAAPEYDMEKSEYLKDREMSNVPGWVWIVGLIVAAGAAFLIVKFII